MFYVRRKATGKLYAEVGRADWLDTVLWNLPTGVYAIEDSEGTEVNTAIVKQRGNVSYVK